MGAWGMGQFENDDAADWLGELCSSKGVAKLERALKIKGGEDEYLEMPDAQTALAACEVVAHMHGQPGTESEASPELQAWLKTNAALLKPSHIKSALAAIDRVFAEDSELNESWEEAEPDDAAAWKASIEDLRTRLGA